MLMAFDKMRSMKKKKVIGSPTIYWGLWQESSPYRDGNIYIEVNGVQKVFTFWTETGNFPSGINCDTETLGVAKTNSLNAANANASYCCGSMKVETPIYEQWVGSGYLWLQIYRSDGTSWEPVFGPSSKPYGPGNTPDYVNTFSETVEVCWGYDYFVSVWANVN
jgi:hypothetical protein